MFPRNILSYHSLREVPKITNTGGGLVPRNEFRSDLIKDFLEANYSYHIKSFSHPERLAQKKVSPNIFVPYPERLRAWIDFLTTFRTSSNQEINNHHKAIYQESIQSYQGKKVYYFPELFSCGKEHVTGNIIFNQYIESGSGGGIYFSTIPETEGYGYICVGMSHADIFFSGTLYSPENYIWYFAEDLRKIYLDLTQIFWIVKTRNEFNFLLDKLNHYNIDHRTCKILVLDQYETDALDRFVKLTNVLMMPFMSEEQAYQEQKPSYYFLSQEGIKIQAPNDITQRIPSLGNSYRDPDPQIEIPPTKAKIINYYVNYQLPSQDQDLVNVIQLANHLDDGKYLSRISSQSNIEWDRLKNMNLKTSSIHAFYLKKTYNSFPPELKKNRFFIESVWENENRVNVYDVQNDPQLLNEILPFIQERFPQTVTRLPDFKITVSFLPFESHDPELGTPQTLGNLTYINMRNEATGENYNYDRL